MIEEINLGEIGIRSGSMEADLAQKINQIIRQLNNAKSKR